MDYAAQIAEKKKRIEELRKQKVNPTIPQAETLLKTVIEPKQHDQAVMQHGQSGSGSPEKQAETKRDQPVNMLSLYFEQKRKKLGFCQVDIFSKDQPEIQGEKATFEFGIQCDLQATQVRRLNTEEEDPEEALPSQPQQNPRRISIKFKPNQQTPIPERLAYEKQQKEDKKPFSTEEINSIVKSNSFSSFFDKTTKIVEKALYNQSVDILEQLIVTDTVQVQDEMKDILTHQVSFFDQVFSYNRVVTSLQWSPNLPETFLAGYSQNEEGTINDQVGVVLLWSLSLKSRPEFYCYCSSAVTSAIFHPFSPSLILGGLYNGQLVVWDLRSKQTPEKRTTLSSGGHSYPIYNLQIIGSQNAHNVVSVSNDGKLCVWNLSMLNQPQKVVDLKTKSKFGQYAGQNVEINVTSMVFPKDDANNFYVGAEDGTVYHSQLHPNQVQNEGQQYLAFEDHQAPITGISLNSPSQQVSPLLQNLMLTSSFDWSVRLWNPRLPKDQCLLTFESSEDYVYDVAWNGNHPTLFSSIDGEGYIDLWDISSDLEAPIKRQKTGQNSLNKHCWNNDGTKVSVGDTQGNVQIFSLDKRALKVDQDKITSLETLIRSKR